MRTKLNRLMEPVKEVRSLMILACITFFIGIIPGIVVYPLIEDEIPKLIEMVFKDVIAYDDLTMTQNIFLRNITATIIILVGGVLILPALALLFLNGAFVGIVAMYANQNGLSIMRILISLIPHAPFELTAFFTSSALGMNIAIQTVKQKGKRKKALTAALWKTLKTYIFIILPLLLFAAFVEVYVSTRLAH